MKVKILPICLSTHYSIYMGSHILKSALFKDCCVTLNKRFVIITDSHLINTFGKQLQTIMKQQGCYAELLSFPAGECHKIREVKQQLEDELLEKRYGRDTCLIALGGGVVTDLVGFLAATYCRGIPVIYIPTSLLAMVDASIGGKTGLNTPHGKNLIGTFTQPHAVFIDIALLNTLPENEWRNGMAEMIKHSVIADASVFEQLKTMDATILKCEPKILLDLIYASCLIKKNIVERDEKEQGLRHLLNFGHTIAHAIENVENYQISHGEAVAIGMLVEAYLSVQYKFLPLSELMTLHELLCKYGLPLKTTAFLDQQQFKNALMLDKKSVENIPYFVLLDRLGKPHYQHHAYTMAVDPALLNQALDWAVGEF